MSRETILSIQRVYAPVLSTCCIYSIYTFITAVLFSDSFLCLDNAATPPPIRRPTQIHVLPTKETLSPLGPLNEMKSVLRSGEFLEDNWTHRLASPRAPLSRFYRSDIC